MALSGSNAAVRKGTNGNVDPKAKAQTYNTKDGQGDRGQSGIPDSSNVAKITSSNC